MKLLRRILVMLVVVGAVQRAEAQENLMEMLRSDVRAEAQQIMTVAMQLSNDEASKFWPVYREYELERARWGDRRIALIRAFAEQYEMMSDEAAGNLASELFGLLDDRLSLYKRYYERFAEAVSPSVAARFIQVERQLNMIIDLQLAQELPLVFKAEGR
jgi:hypothetical protein